MKIHSFTWNGICSLNHSGVLISFDKADIDNKAKTAQLYFNSRFVALILPAQFQNFIDAAQEFADAKAAAEIKAVA